MLVASAVVNIHKWFGSRKVVFFRRDGGLLGQFGELEFCFDQVVLGVGV